MATRKYRKQQRRTRKRKQKGGYPPSCVYNPSNNTFDIQITEKLLEGNLNILIPSVCKTAKKDTLISSQKKISDKPMRKDSNTKVSKETIKKYLSLHRISNTEDISTNKGTLKERRSLSDEYKKSSHKV